MQEKEKYTDDNKTLVEKQNQTKIKSEKATQDFKRKYFEYYDDVKISDRQDW